MTNTVARSEMYLTVCCVAHVFQTGDGSSINDKSSIYPTGQQSKRFRDASPVSSNKYKRTQDQTTAVRQQAQLHEHDISVDKENCYDVNNNITCKQLSSIKKSIPTKPTQPIKESSKHEQVITSLPLKRPAVLVEEASTSSPSGTVPSPRPTVVSSSQQTRLPFKQLRSSQRLSIANVSRSLSDSICLKL